MILYVWIRFDYKEKEKVEFGWVQIDFHYIFILAYIDIRLGKMLYKIKIILYVLYYIYS